MAVIEPRTSQTGAKSWRVKIRIVYHNITLTRLGH